MYLLKVKNTFSSAHNIEGYPGKCGNIHGHNYTVTATFKTETLNHLDIAFDFSDAKSILKNVTSQLDHTNLNLLPQFNGINPTAERIAKIIFEHLMNLLPDKISIYEVEVEETPSNSAIYRP